jgi:hypothetical protein
MKVLISERQLKRLIREFQDIYDNGIDRLTRDVEKDIKAGGFEMFPGGVKDDTWTEKREKESFRLLKMLKEKVAKFLIDYFNLEEGKLVNQINELVNKLFVLSIHDEIQYIYRDTSDWHMSWISNPDIGEYDYSPSEFKGAMNHLMKKVENLLDDQQKKELSTKIEMSKTKYSPKYSGEEIEDEDTKVIYDWEHTKIILENLIKEYIHNEKYVSTELFDKITELGVIEPMIDEMDEDMKNNEYKIFHPILQNNWGEDFLKFVKSYITYYGQEYGEQQFRETIKVDKKLPPEVFFGRLLWDMTYWINKNM